MSADKQAISLHLAGNKYRLHVRPTRSRRQFIAACTGTLFYVTTQRLEMAAGIDKLYWSDKIMWLYIAGCYENLINLFPARVENMASPNNSSRGQMGFNSEFIVLIIYTG